MRTPIVEKDSLGGDVVNLLFLRPVHRKVARVEASPEPPLAQGEGESGPPSPADPSTRDRLIAGVVLLLVALLGLVLLVGAYRGVTAPATPDVVPNGFRIPFRVGVDDPAAVCFARGGVALVYEEGTGTAWCEVAS